MKSLRSWISVVAILISASVLSLLSVMFDTWFFDRQFMKLGSYERQPAALEEAQHLMEYRVSNDAYITRAVYTQDEIAHLYDVKQLIRTVFRVGMGSLAVLLAMLYVYAWRSHRDYRKRSMKASLLCVGVVVAVWWVLFLVDFTRMFEYFHRIFFVDNRSFPEESSFLIQSYPEEFFGRAAVEWIGRTCGILLAFYMITTYAYTNLISSSCKKEANQTGEHDR